MRLTYMSSRDVLVCNLEYCGVPNDFYSTRSCLFCAMTYVGIGKNVVLIIAVGFSINKNMPG
jgi:hypothetical protein